LFPVLRGLIDAAKRAGRRSGQFLLLGSASINLLRQSGESLAGRLARVELTGLTVIETGPRRPEPLWLRGGFPDSLTARDDGRSTRWREAFVRSYLERDIPRLGPRIAAETLRRFWTMLAHEHGGLLNAAQLARSLAVSGKTIASYIDLFVDLFLLRRLERGFHHAREDVRPERCLVVCSTDESFSLGNGIEAISLPDTLRTLQ